MNLLALQVKDLPTTTNEYFKIMKKLNETMNFIIKDSTSPFLLLRTLHLFNMTIWELLILAAIQIQCTKIHQALEWVMKEKKKSHPLDKITAICQVNQISLLILC